MNYETLKLFRLFIPGILLFTFFAYLRDYLLPSATVYIPNILTDNDGLKYSLYLAVFSLTGVLYNSSGLRNILLDRLQPEINANIRIKLFDAVRKDVDLSGIKESDKDGEMMGVFYYFIGKDPSLSEKSKAVRFNGLLWTTSMDVVVIATIALLTFIAALAFRHDTPYIQLIIFCIVLACLAVETLFAVHEEHIKLSNEQLKIITRRYKIELIDKIKNETL